MSDISQAHHPERLESARMEVAEESPYIIKLEEEFVHIKEEQEEYFMRVENPHIEEQQQPHPLKKEEEDPPYVKVEVVNIPKWTSEPLKDKDGGPSEASRGKEPPNSSRSKEGYQADNLIARPSESDDFTSHSLFYTRPDVSINANSSQAVDQTPQCASPFTIAARGKMSAQQIEECHRKVTAYFVKRLHPFSDVESPTFRLVKQ
ncbi:uncharacterized protein LOC130927674 isoform X3 [Corythoichthys intestinalis]|uniref:uncharacterized protein LOC130927674 isoform X3 n=1 Tax=Corythoichthys intestinalis TaxID=161448 RepID=UPI0025A66499|nr:uncharacterized protein LOC130927674 isoform X3 [Corythoichthys intestinalis]